jgi:hemoglobin
MGTSVSREGACEARWWERFAGLRAHGGAPLEAFKASLEDQLCEIAHGPCEYRGLDMRAVHRGLHISDEQFDAFLQDFRAALVEAKVEKDETYELVDALRAMRDDVVE